jgi:outer membrane immunogenic protein
MTSIRFVAAVAAGVVSAGLALLSAAPAEAQNSEGAFQIRAGAFVDTGSTRLHETDIAGPLTGRTGQFGFGGSGGFEYLRAGAWTMGLEADLGVSGGGSRTLNAVKYGADFFSSLRGRAGFYLRPDWVAYGTGGVAFRGISVDAGALGKTEKTLTGSIFGGGMEFHRDGTILFAEYLHSNFGGVDVPAGANGIARVSADSDIFRIGVKFKLGYDGYYDYVRK